MTLGIRLSVKEQGRGLCWAETPFLYSPSSRRYTEFEVKGENVRRRGKQKEKAERMSEDANSS